MRKCKCGNEKVYGLGLKFCLKCQGKKDKAHLASVLKKYGVTPTDYQAMLSNQGNTCYVCQRKPGKRRLAIDHRHSDGVVRGLLCGRCNTYIGHIKDDIDAAQRLLTYLKKC